MASLTLDKIRGVVFGQAIGDALGFGTEFLSKSDVAFTYPDGLTDYSQIRFFSRINNRFEQPQDWRWQPGDWTDDTDLMLCIFDSLLANQEINFKDIAARFHDWAMKDGFGIGGTMSKVINDPEFLENPHHAALQFWELQERQSAANGAVMRTSILGLWQYKDPQQVKLNAENVCALTHADPRCIASCVAVCLTISLLVRGAVNLEKLVDEIRQEVHEFHPEIEEYFKKARETSLEALRLDEGLNLGEQVKLGYTLKTLGAAFWALLHAQTFREGMLSIIHEGGDADTNAAVAGALLGARFGYSSIPSSWIDGLVYKEQLWSRVGELVKLLDL
jgi:ADP-ribosylglycohydrolase